MIVGIWTAAATSRIRRSARPDGTSRILFIWDQGLRRRAGREPGRLRLRRRVQQGRRSTPRSTRTRSRRCGTGIVPTRPCTAPTSPVSPPATGRRAGQGPAGRHVRRRGARGRHHRGRQRSNGAEGLGTSANTLDARQLHLPAGRHAAAAVRGQHEPRRQSRPARRHQPARTRPRQPARRSGPGVRQVGGQRRR